MRLRWVVQAALLGTVLASVALHARPIHYSAVKSDALAECDSLYWRGEKQSSTGCFQTLLQNDPDAAIRAEAAWALGDLHAANRLFRSAAAARPADATVLTRWGDLFADSHQDAEAIELYRDALQVDDENAFAMLGAARVLTGAFSKEANAYLEPLLTNATLAEGAKLGAWLLTARMALENDNLEEAEESLAIAEALVEKNAWPPLEVYALRAAADLINEQAASPWTERSLDYNPVYGDIYAVPAHFYVISRRYRQAIDLYQKAVDIEPGLASAHVDLGVNLLRDNQFSRARKHLEQAHEVDPFSPIAVNTLRLLDSFENFKLVEDPAPGTQSAELPIVMRLHRDEAAAIEPYAIELTRQSIAEFSQRYDFELREPAVIEMYPDHEDFAVRTAGMPGIGILGATFGYVVAMDSPSARSTDQFQWGTTLWHEMAHVFTLEASDHLVPRWFSEGVSVFEEWRSGPTPGVRIPMSVYGAMRDDRLLPIATLDQGFIRPSYPDQVIVSYMQAGLVCQFIDAQFGDDKLALMLKQFAAGLDTVETIAAVLDLSAPQFDRDFERFVQREHGEVLVALDAWQEAHAGLANRAGNEDWQGVIDDAAAVIELHPGYVEPDSPYLMLARAHDELDAPDKALDALREFWQRGGFDPGALKRLATRLEESGQAAEAIAALKTVTYVQPLDESLHEQLGRLLLAEGDGKAALREYEILLALEPHDKANAYLRVAEAHQAIGNIDQSRNYVLQALDFAPGFRPAQRLLLELSRNLN